MEQDVQTFHRLNGAVTLHGEVETEPPATHLARVLAWCIRTPRTPTRGPIRITLDTAGTEEIWTRQFPRHTMRSTLSLHRGYLTERLGAVRLFFGLETHYGVLRMRLQGLRFLGIPCPAWLRPAVLARNPATVTASTSTCAPACRCLAWLRRIEVIST